MIAMIIFTIAMAVVATTLSLQTQLVETAHAYRKEVQVDALSRFYMPIRDHADRLGLWPTDKAGLAAFADVLRDPVLASTIIDDPVVNQYDRFIAYAQSEENRGAFEVKRSVLFYIDPDDIAHDESSANGFLSAARNPCGGAYRSGEAWCPPVIADGEYTFYRSAGSQKQHEMLLRQEARLKRLAQRVGNFMSYNDARYPDTSAVSDSDQALYELVTTDAAGASQASLDPSTSQCDETAVYYWDGVPVTCRDMFSVWHIDTVRLENDASGTLSAYATGTGLTESDLKIRFHSPVRVFDDGTAFLLYAYTPFKRKGETDPVYTYMDISL